MSKDRDGETTVIKNEISTPHSLHNNNLLKQQVYVKSICSTEFLLWVSQKERSTFREGVCICGDRAYFYRDGQIPVLVFIVYLIAYHIDAVHSNALKNHLLW